MKVTKPFCIDAELLGDLKNINASELVNSLLTEHLDGKNSLNLGKMKALLSKNLEKKKKLLHDIRDLRARIAIIEQKEAKILKISKQYPDYIFKLIDGCSSVMVFYANYRNDIKLKAYSWIELKKLYNNLKGGENNVQK